MFKFKPALLFSNKLLFILIMIVVIATMLANTRFGTLGFAAGIMSMLFLVLAKELNRNNLKKMLAVLSLLTVVVLSIIYSSWENDSRWKNLLEDVKLGWNAPTDFFCFVESPDAPRMVRADGSYSDGSNSCRPAYIHRAIELVESNPLGSGPGKDLYRTLLQQKFNNDRITISQSHSGLLELSLQYGIPGLLLWLCFNAITLRQAWRSYANENDAISLFLLIFVIGFLSRSIIDRNMVDHFFEQFMFVSAVLLSITWSKDRKES